MKREAEAKRARIILAIGIVFMLAGSFFSSFIVRMAGGVSIRELRFENPSGSLITANLYKPASFAKEAKMPAVVVVAGEYENKEELDFVAIELARRGIVAMAMDNQGHGGTEINPGTPEYQSINDAAAYLSGISYVDPSKIAVLGFTKYAGDMINNAVLDDNNGSDRLISAVMYVAADPMYGVAGAYANLYEGRHVGVVSAKFDDLSHHRTLSPGSDPDAFSVDYPTSFDAISFLNFGRDPSRLTMDAVDSVNQIHRYGNRDNGAIRVIYAENLFRPDVYYSPVVMRDACSFFSEAFGTSKGSIASQIWPYRLLLNAISLIGLALVVMSVAMLFTRTQFFADVSLLNETDEEYMVFPMRIVKGDLAGKIWFWLAVAGALVFAVGTYMRMAGLGYDSFRSIPQRETFAISAWLFINSIYLLGASYLWYRFYSMGRDCNLVRLGVVIPKVTVAKTALLGVLTAFISYFAVFICRYLFSSDISFFALAFKSFTISRLISSVWPYMLLMVVFFISLSIFQNTLMYNSLLGKFNSLFTAVAAALPCVIIPSAQYIGFSVNGRPLFFNQAIPYNEFALWLIPMQFVMFGTTFVTRYVFSRTKNNYLPGIINAIVITLMLASNTKMF